MVTAVEEATEIPIPLTENPEMATRKRYVNYHKREYGELEEYAKSSTPHVCALVSPMIESQSAENDFIEIP